MLVGLIAQVGQWWPDDRRMRRMRLPPTSSTSSGTVSGPAAEPDAARSFLRGGVSGGRGVNPAAAPLPKLRVSAPEGEAVEPAVFEMKAAVHSRAELWTQSASGRRQQRWRSRCHP